jgi:hypothetical protein
MNKWKLVLMLSALIIAGCAQIFYSAMISKLTGTTVSELDDLPPLPPPSALKAGLMTLYQHARPQLHISPNDSFGACLMMKEDNDLLYEWIAFHYISLPLRYLFVGSDSGNTQDPRVVLDRWNETDLTYWVVDDNYFVNKHGPTPSRTEDAERAHHGFIHRQRGFITVCSEFMKAQNMSWVSYHDSDEFIVPQYVSKTEDEARQAAGDLDSKDDAPYSMRKRLHGANTILEAIRRVIQEIKPCYTMPRVLFSSLENITCPDAVEVTELAKREFNYGQMSTLRFKQRASQGDFATGKFGKVIVDLSRIQNVSAPPKNIHRPFKPACEYPAPVFQTSLFYINHYVGSWERYSSRMDDRRSCKEWMSRAYFDKGNSCDQHIHEWFSRFIDTMGTEKAKYLLGVDRETETTKPVNRREECPPVIAMNEK